MSPDRSLTRRGLLRGAVGFAGLAAVGPTLPGCGADRSTSAPMSTQPSVAPKRGGHLKAAFIGGSNESASVLLAQQTALTYVRGRMIWDSVGELVDGKPRWRLAESVESNRDATQWTIRLRAGLTFSDGAALTADDVAGSLTSYIKGNTPQGAFLSRIDLKGMRAKDNRTLVLPMKAPDGLLDLALAQSVFVFPADTVDPTKALGSGPYLSTSYTPGRGAVLTRNPNYWDDGGPYLDTLEFVNVADASARLNGLKSGQFQYAASVALSAARAERANPEIALQIPEQNLWTDVVVNANISQQPFTDRTIVEALHYTFDRETLLDTVALGMGEVGNDLLGKGDPNYDTEAPQWSFDPDRAKHLLASVDAGDLSLSIRTGDFEYGMLETATAWIDQAKQVGIRLSLDKVASNDYFSDYAELNTTPLQSMNLSAFPLGLTATYYYGTAAFFPFTGLVSPEVDKLVTAVRTAVGDERRGQALAAFQRYVRGHAGHYVPIRLPTVAATSQQVHGVEAAGFAAFPSFRNAFLA